MNDHDASRPGRSPPEMIVGEMKKLRIRDVHVPTKHFSFYFHMRTEVVRGLWSVAPRSGGVLVEKGYLREPILITLLGPLLLQMPVAMR